MEAPARERLEVPGGDRDHHRRAREGHHRARRDPDLSRGENRGLGREKAVRHAVGRHQTVEAHRFGTARRVGDARERKSDIERCPDLNHAPFPSAPAAQSRRVKT